MLLNDCYLELPISNSSTVDQITNLKFGWRGWER